jgi:hypothetical protein
MRSALAKNLEEAIEMRRRDPVHPVETVAGKLHVEVRVKEARSAADLFHEVGPWEGETAGALWKRLAEERRLGGSGEPPTL